MPTISEIECAVINKSPYFFSPDTLEFFEQSKSDFKVKVSPTGRTFVYAPCRYNGKVIGYTLREFTGNDLAVTVLSAPRSKEQVLDFIESQ